MTSRITSIVGTVIAVLLFGFLVVFATGSEQNDGQDSSTDLATGAAAVSEQVFSDLPSMSEGELPLEALDTLDLIDSGGPYPFDRDDLVFQNREGLLPDRSRGHYREYTVITPGENDRGARRIVAGDDGERYYTADHYSSFREIVASTG